MNIKLIIWDLDDTLWRGSLAERDEINLFAHRAEYIRLLNERGIVSAICSKNDPVAAREALTAFGLWEEFVFPRISFTPKAPAVQQLIVDMQLRPENVLFIDDNPINLREVKFLLPEILTVDATTDLCDQYLDALIREGSASGRSRIQDYRRLEARSDDRRTSNLSQEDFLRSCNIHVALVHRMDNLDFASRIEELVNRSNQLNFTNSRLAQGSVPELVADILNFECFSVFVWDDYGYHGLVGFVMLDKEKKIVHFTFSCRIMHMRIESWTLNELKRMFPRLDTSSIPVTASQAGWISAASFHEPSVRSRIYENEFSSQNEAPRLRIMANCQSGAIAHFSGLASKAMFDNAPQAFDPKKNFDRVFYLRFLRSGEYINQTYPEMLVYGAFVDYADGYWPGIAGVDLESAIYPECVERFCDFVQTSGRKALVILPFEKAPRSKIPEHFGISLKRLSHFNRLWRKAARSKDRIEILDLNLIATEAEAIDVRHYSVALLKKIADRTRGWHDRNLCETSPRHEITY